MMAGETEGGGLSFFQRLVKAWQILFPLLAVSDQVMNLKDWWTVEDFPQSLVESHRVLSAFIAFIMNERFLRLSNGS